MITRVKQIKANDSGDIGVVGVAVAVLALVTISPLAMIGALVFDNSGDLNYYLPSTGWYSSWMLTIFYALFTTVFQLLVGVSLALGVFFYRPRSRWKRLLLLILVLLPYSIPTTITVMMFDLGLAENGYINNLLTLFFGLAEPIQSTPMGRFFCLCVVSVWQYFPFFLIITLISFDSVPTEIIRQAKMDGVSDFRLAVGILLPWSMQAILAASILRLILMIGKIDIALAFHKKSAIAGAETLPVQIIEQTFAFGAKTPIGLILVLALILITPILIYMFSQMRRVE